MADRTRTVLVRNLLVRSLLARGVLVRNLLVRSLTALLLAAGLSAMPAAAYAATLTQVTGFGSNPGNLTMYSYRPDGLPAGAPLVVALHGCTQNANDYFGHAGWQKYADLWHFALVFAEQKSANNANSCFNWFESGDTARGQGEALSIAQMASYAVSTYHLNGSRVYVTGLSAGAAMTAVMLATYPDTFGGGGIVAGLAYHCATDLSTAYICMNTTQGETPAQWGDLVRGANPGYPGPWPRVSVWYGSSDTTVVPANATELRDQWTNVWGLSQTPSGSSSLSGGTTLDVYDSGGAPAVSVYRVANIGHGTPVDPGGSPDQCGTTGTYYLDSICSSYYLARAWGLDGGGQPPGGPPAPTGLRVSGTTDTSVSLAWSAVSGAAGYHVYRDGTRVTGAPVGGTSYTDGGLAPGTSYSYAVSAVDQSTVEGSRSGPVSGTTTGSGGACVTANNYAQVAAGRAHQSGGYTYANGSNDAMGLYNTFVTHTLKQTGANYWVLADGQC